MARTRKPHIPPPGPASPWLAGAGAPSSIGRRSAIYELVVLGELLGGPHHGYLLREILGKIFGPFRQVSWGALYPLIHRLAEQGLITPEPHTAPAAASARAARAQPTLYAITPSGRERLLALMTTSPPYRAYDPDLFLAKLGYVDHVSPAQQRDLLLHHLGFLRAVDDSIATTLRQVQAEPHIPPQERQRIEWVTEFRRSRLAAERSWVETALAQLPASNP